jgi:hypothetical protein
MHSRVNGVNTIEQEYKKDPSDCLLMRMMYIRASLRQVICYPASAEWGGGEEGGCSGTGSISPIFSHLLHVKELTQREIFSSSYGSYRLC